MAEPQWPQRGMFFRLFLYVGWEAATISFLLMLGALAISIYKSPPNAFNDKNTWNGTNAVTLTPTNAVSATPPNAVTLPHSNDISSTTTRGVMAVFFIVCITAICSALYKAHLKRVYDPTLVIHFEKEFEELAEQRGKAAAVLLEYSKGGDWGNIPSADEIEPVLDFFDNLGFYLYGNQISERVLHQSFCHWIRLYYQEGCSYIRLRREGADPEKSTWEHVEYLVDEVFAIEAAKQGCSPQSLKLNPKKYKKYLLEEFDGSDDAFKNDFMKLHSDIFAPPAASASNMEEGD